MSEALSDDQFTAEERDYLERGGAVAEPKAEPAARPEPPPAEAAPAPTAAEPPASDIVDDDGEDEAGHENGEGSRQRRVKFETYQRVKTEGAELRKQIEEQRQHREAREREFAAFRAAAEERLRMLAHAQQQAAQPAPQAPAAPPPTPNVDEDPVAFIRWQNEQLQAQADRLNQFEQGVRQSAEQQRQSAAVSHLERMYRDDNSQAAREMPEYPQAYDFLVTMAARDIQIQNGGRLTPHQVKAHLENQERQLAAAAFQQNMRPAQMILAMAHARGWKPAQQQAQLAPQSDPAAEQARVDAAARGQAQNRTLSSAGRGGPIGGMSVDKLLDMPEAEFAEWTAKNPEALARMQGAA